MVSLFDLYERGKELNVFVSEDPRMQREVDALCGGERMVCGEHNRFALLLSDAPEWTQLLYWYLRTIVAPLNHQFGPIPVRRMKAWQPANLRKALSDWHAG